MTVLSLIALLLIVISCFLLLSALLEGEEIESAGLEDCEQLRRRTLAAYSAKPVYAKDPIPVLQTFVATSFALGAANKSSDPALVHHKSMEIRPRATKGPQKKERRLTPPLCFLAHRWKF